MSEPSSPEREALGSEMIQILLDLLNPLHAELDRQTHYEKVKENFDAPPDREYNVNITTLMVTNLAQAVCVLENRQNRLAALTPCAVEPNWKAVAERAKAAGDKVLDDARVDPADLQKPYRAAETAGELKPIGCLHAVCPHPEKCQEAWKCLKPMHASTTTRARTCVRRWSYSPIRQHGDWAAHVIQTQVPFVALRLRSAPSCRHKAERVGESPRLGLRVVLR
jgi:hypothetical protein